MPGLFLSEKVFAECASVISLSYGYDSKLPIGYLSDGASAIFEGLLYFCNGCGNGKVRCNGRGKPV